MVGTQRLLKRWRTAYDPGVTTWILEYRLKSDALKVTGWVAYPLAPDEDGQPMRNRGDFRHDGDASAPTRPRSTLRPFGDGRGAVCTA